MAADANEESINISDEIKKLIRVAPFRPFVIVMASGDRYEVTDGYQVAVGGSVVVIVPAKSTTITLKNTMISSLEVVEPV